MLCEESESGQKMDQILEIQQNLQFEIKTLKIKNENLTRNLEQKESQLKESEQNSHVCLFYFSKKVCQKCVKNVSKK